MQSGRQLAGFRTPGITAVSCFALSPDGRVAAVCGLPDLNLSQTAPAHGTLLLYDVATGRRLRAIPARSAIDSVAFRPRVARRSSSPRPRRSAAARR